MSQTNRKLTVWRRRVVILSLLLFFFAIPHTLEDFALGEQAENGVPAQAVTLMVAGLFTVQGLALFWAGQGHRRNYFIHAGLGVIWPLAAGMANLRLILTLSNYRSGFISIWYEVGMIVTVILLLLASLQVLRTGAQVKQEAMPGNISRV